VKCVVNSLCRSQNVALAVFVSGVLAAGVALAGGEEDPALGAADAAVRAHVVVSQPAAIPPAPVVSSPEVGDSAVAAVVSNAASEPAVVVVAAAEPYPVPYPPDAIVA
jgi:hypothetical protein